MMVILWTQLDGDNQDPAEKLTQGPSDLIEDVNKNGIPLEHPRVDGRPPSGKSPSKSKVAKDSSPASPKNFLKRKAKYFRRTKSLPSRGSQRQVVSVKAVEFPVQVATPPQLSSPESVTSESSPTSPLQVVSNGSSPESCCSTDEDKSPKTIDSLKVSHVLNESATRVTISRNGTIKKDSSRSANATKDTSKSGSLRKESSPNFIMESDDEVPTENNFTRSKSKRKFYTLPRNWKSQAIDLFRNKGCFGRKASPSPSIPYQKSSPQTVESPQSLESTSPHYQTQSSKPYYNQTSDPVQSSLTKISDSPTNQFSPTPRPGDGVSNQAVTAKLSQTSDSRKTFCEHCKKKCSGEVLRVHDNYYHIACFSCSNCKKSLSHGGFFSRDSNFFCTDCYHEKFGQQCATCGKYVEGEVVSALGNTYHQKCFLCARCRQPFPSGERVTYTGKECLCQKCYQIPVVDSLSPARSPTSDAPKCAGCKQELVEGQALIALDQQWHIWCFKCASCNTLLHGEYMGKDGLPYCEKDYQNQFGVKCAYCDRFITGKVLQAGDNHHFHPTCARCTKCGDPFGDGEEMYLQGTAIWHPRCGPGPTENGTVINGSLTNGHHMNGDHNKTDRDLDGMSSTASETQFSRSCTPSLNGSLRSNSPYNSLNRKYSGPYRTCSPGLILREYKSSHSPIDISRIYTYSYLAAEPTQSYLKKPIDPYDRPPKSPHFHRPPNDTRRVSLPKASSRLGMRVLVETIQSETPRPKSPKMNNEEPIILSHYPGAKPPKDGQTSRIERDDFPAPPYPYTDPERRRRWSGSSKGVSVDEIDGMDEDETDFIDPKLKKEEEELSKISTGIGKVFLQQVKEREKMQAWKHSHVDPRNASRTPSAKQEPGYRMRFESSINASPSRFTDHSRPWEEDEFEPVSSFRCSTGRSSTTFPNYNVVSSLRQVPKPGYGFSSRPVYSRQGLGSYHALPGDYHHYGGQIGNKTHSTDFSSARSDVSACSLTEADGAALNAELCPSATYSSNLRGYSCSPHFRRSLPNMHHMASDPPKIYPAHLLVTCNYRLPNDVDRCHLERHLSDTDFELIFRMTRLEFYRMPEWKRNDIKRRARFF